VKNNMSSRDYLRNKMAALPKTIKVQQGTDSSMLTQKRKFIATQTFFIDGTAKGALLKSTDGSSTTLNNPAGSSIKQISKGGDASNYTAYRGNVGIAQDTPFLTGGYKSVPCDETVSVTINNFNTASSRTLKIKSCPAELGNIEEPSMFVDNTIRLSSGVPSLLNPCCNPNVPARAYNRKTDGPKTFFKVYQPFSRNVTKPWIGPQGYEVQPFNVTNARKIGGYVPILSLNNSVMPKHGNPMMEHEWHYEGRRPLYGNYVALKIDRPTLFNIKG
jgi:hypothetical protein